MDPIPLRILATMDRTVLRLNLHYRLGLLVLQALLALLAPLAPVQE